MQLTVRRVLLGVGIALAGLAAAAFAGLAFAAFSYFAVPESSEPGDWSTQPLEVIADDGVCLLNVESVAPGKHEVYVIAVSAPAEVLVRDDTGRVVLRHSAQPDTKTGMAPAVELRLGVYEVECRSAGSSSSVSLRVVDAAELG